MSKMNRNLLGEALTIKDDDELRAFIKSLSKEEQVELLHQVNDAIDPMIKFLHAFGIKICEAFTEAAVAMTAFGDVLRQTKH